MLLAACALVFAAECRAETRIIAVKVTLVEKAAPKVDVYSDVKSEDKRGLSVDDAAGILKDAEGWESKVVVGIEAHGIPLQDYMPLLTAVSKNGWLELAFVEGRPPSFLFDNLKKRIRQK